MSNELREIFPASKTVTVTVLLDGTSSSPSVTEASGVYSADYSNATAGIASIWWQNTTDSTEVRYRAYWDGSAFLLVPASITAQQVRDSNKLPHSDGDYAIDVKLNNLEAIALDV